jgi:hypothetical protein
MIPATPQYEHNGYLRVSLSTRELLDRLSRAFGTEGYDATISHLATRAASAPMASRPTPSAPAPRPRSQPARKRICGAEGPGGAICHFSPGHGGDECGTWGRGGRKRWPRKAQ